MKKKIQKYLAGEREGFSLVELIIVIAIMAILIGVVTLAVLPNIAKSKESKDITALDSLLSAVNNAVASKEVAKGGKFSVALTDGKSADLTQATAAALTGGGAADKNVAESVRQEVIKLMGKNKIEFSSAKVCDSSNTLQCQWDLSGANISIEVAIVKNNKIVAGEYVDNFASANGPLLTPTEAPAAPSAT